MPALLMNELAAVLEKTADDGRHWLKFCDVLAKVFGGVGTSLVPVDVSRRAFRTQYSPSLNAVLAEYQKDGWYNRDYRQRCAPILIERGYALDTDIVTPREMELLPYYKDLLRKHGLGGFVGIHIQTRYGSWCAAVQLPFGQLEPTQRQLAQVPQIRNMTETAAEKAALSGVAKRFAWGENLRTTGHESAIVDPNGILTARSGGLEALLAPFGRVDDRFHLQEPAMQSALQTALSGCFDAGLDALLPEPIYLKSHKSRVAADFIRFPAALVHFFDVPEIIVLFRNVAASETISRESLARRFGLTNSEMELLRELVRGSMVKDAAVTLKITEGSARQRLKAIFRKTGTEAQHQLVAMAYQSAGYSIESLFDGRR